MKNKIKNLTFLSIFMLFSFYSLKASDDPESDFHECDRIGCEEFSTTVTMSEFVRVGDCMVEVFFDLFTCPEDVFTINLKGFNLDCSGGSVPPNADIMKAIKKYLLTIAHPIANNGEIFPNGFEVEILSPSCYYLKPEGGGHYSASITGNPTGPPYTMDCENKCCSNTYTLSAYIYTNQLSVTNVDRSTESETSSTCPLTPNYCQNACAEDEIEEGFLNFDYFSCGLDGLPYLFGETLTNGYSPPRKYMSSVDFKSTSGTSYSVHPRLILGINSVGVEDEDDMKNYIMDLINNRVSLFGVSAGDEMKLYINQCWSNFEGNAYPCSNECCEFTIQFQGLFNERISISLTSGGSATCTSPCFEVCDKILELNNQIIINAKENIEIEDNPNIYEDLKIIPNPSSGITNIQFKSESNGNVEMHIMTLDGQTVAIRNFAKKSNIVNYEFNTKTFSNGTYFVKIILDGQQRITKKIIIQN